MKYEIWIPEYRPASLNQLINSHWAKANAMKKSDKLVVRGYMSKFRVPKATGKRKVSLHCKITSRMRERDYDGEWKSLLDALSNCGAIIDDNPKNVELGSVTYERSPEWGTTIILTDI